MNTNEDINKKISETEIIYNRLAMEIGHTYSAYVTSKDKNLISKVNSKVSAFQKVELQLRTLENELINPKD